MRNRLLALAVVSVTLVALWMALVQTQADGEMG